jgi:hypothetical protein
MADTGEHAFVPKKMKISVWGMDAAGRPFTESMQTVRIARDAVEVDTPRRLKVEEIVGVGANGMKSRFRVFSTLLVTKDTWRTLLEDLGSTCMWEKELADPDAAEAQKAERRKHQRWPVRGSAVLYNTDRSSSSTARLADISRGGYYIETLAPSPTGSQLEVLIECNQIRVETRGKVCTSHPSIGMGVQIEGFLSPQDEQRFETLLETVEGGMQFA